MEHEVNDSFQLAAAAAAEPARSKCSTEKRGAIACPEFETAIMGHTTLFMSAHEKGIDGPYRNYAKQGMLRLTER